MIGFPILYPCLESIIKSSHQRDAYDQTSQLPLFLHNINIACGKMSNFNHSFEIIC